MCIFRRRKHRTKLKFCKTLNGRLPPEDGSVRPQTLGKRVSDDSQRFIFRHRKTFWTIFLQKNLILEILFQETGDLGEPDTFVRHWQIRRKKLLPEVGLLLGRLPWRRGKRLNLCRKS